MKINAADNLHPIPRIRAAKIRELTEALPSANFPDTARGRGRLVFRVCFVHVRASARAEESADNFCVFARFVAFKNGYNLISQIKQDIILVRIVIFQLVLRACASGQKQHGNQRHQRK
ncbi:hypothetical protein SDC9_135296 [bioreactor metagenome]|uniref:Uncharacterized protein n=1 Tax=bioreactor metagenome TaxID=1076179 RepID=A0A645DG46_9ZZZZ